MAPARVEVLLDGAPLATTVEPGESWSAAARRLAPAVDEPVAVDLSGAMLEKARARVRDAQLTHVEQVVVADAEALHFADNSVDAVVAQYVVTACPHPERALDEFARICRPGGEIIITTRVGAGQGLRGAIERTLMPLTSRLGFRTEFP